MHVPRLSSAALFASVCLTAWPALAAGPQATTPAEDGRHYTVGKGALSCFVACYATTGLERLKLGEDVYVVGLLQLAGRYGASGNCEPIGCSLVEAPEAWLPELRCSLATSLDDDHAVAALCEDAFGDAGAAAPKRSFWAGGDTRGYGGLLGQTVVNLEEEPCPRAKLNKQGPGARRRPCSWGQTPMDNSKDKSVDPASRES